MTGGSISKILFERSFENKSSLSFLTGEPIEKFYKDRFEDFRPCSFFSYWNIKHNCLCHRKRTRGSIYCCVHKHRVKNVLKKRQIFVRNLVSKDIF